jgi:hypothetical protein
VRDGEYDSLLSAEAERAAVDAAGAGASAEARGAGDRRIDELTGTLYECPSCGRLLWRRPGAEEYRSYAPEPPAS